MGEPNDSSPREEIDVVALAIDAAPVDDREETEEERRAVGAARAEPGGYVEAHYVARALEALAHPKTG